ncbi:hypothetical protein F4Y59_00865 [Candidatus Poribacteria bacterium]|nr:hypothetical protein [Candidatus Poribacteria bacterium]MYK19600.1 hypothetical protein [Candidatus Poribacteria bacterium]
MLGELLSRKSILASIVFFFLIVTGSLIYHQHVQRVLQVDVDRTKRLVQLKKKQMRSAEDIADTATGVAAHTESAEEKACPDSVSPWHLDSSETSAETGIVEETEDDFLMLNTDEETLPTNSVEDRSLKLLADWMDDLNSRLQVRYPEIMELPTLSAAEIANRYATEEDRQRLHQLSQQLLAEFLVETKEFVSHIPDDLYLKVKEELYKQLSENWGQEAAEKAMSDLQQLIE